jgi:hypothetical protein
MCKKCKQKVVNATKCLKCENVYHKGCVQALINNGKNIYVIHENAMLCEELNTNLSVLNEACLSVIQQLKNENEVLKNEVETLKSKISELKTDKTSGIQVDELMKNVITEVNSEMMRGFFTFKTEINKIIDRRFRPGFWNGPIT